MTVSPRSLSAGVSVHNMCVHTGTSQLGPGLGIARCQRGHALQQVTPPRAELISKSYDTSAGAMAVHAM